MHPAHHDSCLFRRCLQDEDGFLEGLTDRLGVGDEDEENKDDEDEEDEDDEEEVLPAQDLAFLDFMPSVEGTFAPTVREPWRSERELKRVRGRSSKGGRKKSSRKR